MGRLLCGKKQKTKNKSDHFTLHSSRSQSAGCSLAPILYQSMPDGWQVHNLWENAARSNLSTKTVVCVQCIGAFTVIFHFAWIVSLFSMFNFKVQEQSIFNQLHWKTHPELFSLCTQKTLVSRSTAHFPMQRLHELKHGKFNKREVEPK